MFKNLKCPMCNKQRFTIDNNQFDCLDKDCGLVVDDDGYNFSIKINKIVYDLDAGKEENETYINFKLKNKDQELKFDFYSELPNSKIEAKKLIKKLIKLKTFL